MELATAIREGKFDPRAVGLRELAIRWHAKERPDPHAAKDDSEDDDSSSESSDKCDMIVLWVESLGRGQWASYDVCHCGDHDPDNFELARDASGNLMPPEGVGGTFIDGTSFSYLYTQDEISVRIDAYLDTL